MSVPGFWDRPDEAQKTVAAMKRARRSVDDWSTRDESIRSIAEMLELSESESDEGMLNELNAELDRVEQAVHELEQRSLLSGEYDRLGAIVSIHPGAGGTESQD